MTLEERLERLERKIDGLSRLIKDMKRPYWVRVGVITALTGWNKEGMRAARENGYVNYKEKDGSHWYDLNSIHSKFIKINP